jgi:tetratricopeptide (TPR) repeat protein
VTSTEVDAPYTLRSLEEMLGLGRSVITGLINAGFVSPARGARNEYRFTFQDVVLLRTAHHLKAAKIPSRRLLNSLKQLKANLPAEIPLTGLRIRAMGNDVAVRNADAQWEADSGQLLMDFEVAASKGTVSFLQRSAAGVVSVGRTAADWFLQGEELEGDDRIGAEAAYREALAAAPQHTNAALNLGAMLCESGRCDEALALFDQAISLSPDEPLLYFNRAVALEDQHRDREALESYEHALRLEPDLADAHYNAARLHDRLGDRQGALRHYSAYRRLRP